MTLKTQKYKGMNEPLVSPKHSQTLSALQTIQQSHCSFVVRVSQTSLENIFKTATRTTNYFVTYVLRNWQNAKKGTNLVSKYLLSYL